MKFFIPITLFLLTCLGNLSAQIRPEGKCSLVGMEDQLLMQRLRQSKQTAALFGEEAIFSRVSYLPVAYHIIRDDEGAGGVVFTDLLDQICSLNEYYAAQQTNMQFFAKDITYTNSSEVYRTHYSTAGKQVMNNLRQEKVINVFIVENASPSADTDGETFAYYSPSADWIVARKGEINGQSETLFHELGHFFGLPHPFRGWDNDVYDPAVHGVQVGIYAPSTGYQTAIFNELQDGSNCDKAADEICDTPPDYNFSSVDWQCNYTGGAKDPNGVLVNPDEKNIMGYFISCSGKSFSPQQKNLMGANLFNRFLDETITLDETPNTTPLTTTPSLLSPPQQSITPVYNVVAFDWHKMPGASGYILQISRNPNFISIDIERISDIDFLELESEFFEPNKIYFWRVRAFNEAYPCSGWSAPFRFTTGLLAGVENSAIERPLFSLSPNPVAAGRAIRLEANLGEKQDSRIFLFSITGKLLREWSPVFLAGTSSLSLGSDDLPAGIYVLVVRGPFGEWREKLVIE